MTSLFSFLTFIKFTPEHAIILMALQRRCIQLYFQTLKIKCEYASVCSRCTRNIRLLLDLVIECAQSHASSHDTASEAIVYLKELVLLENSAQLIM